MEEAIIDTMSSVQARKDEILAKKAKLAELKRQRELRQKEFTSNRQSVDAAAVNEVENYRDFICKIARPSD